MFQPGPEVCILPLGTGNDLSRVLGWGEGFSNDVDVCEIMRLMSSAEVVKLDRFVLHYTTNSSSKSMSFFNFMSVSYQHYINTHLSW